MAQPQLLRNYKQACAAMEPVEDPDGDPRRLAAAITGLESRALAPHAVELSGRCPDPYTGDLERPVLLATRSGSWINLSARCSCCVLEGGEICIHGQALANAAWIHLHEDDGDPGVARLHELLERQNLGHRVAEDAAPGPRAGDEEERALALFDRLAGTMSEGGNSEEQRRLAWRLGANPARPLQAVLQTLGRRGWRKGEPLNPGERPRIPLDTRDLALLQLTGSAGYGSSGLDRLEDWRLLAGHPLLQGPQGQPVTVAEEPLAVAVRGQPGIWRLVFPQLADETCLWSSTFADGVAVLARDGAHLRLLSASGEQLRLLASSRNLRISDAVAHSEAFRSVMAGVEAELPPELEGEPAEADPAAHLLLAWDGERLEARIAVRPLLAAAWQAPSHGPVRIHARNPEGRWVVALRQPAEEAARGLKLREALGLPPQTPWTWRLDLEPAADLIERAALLHLRPHWAGKPLTTAEADSAGLLVKVERRRDWFAVEAGVRVDDQVVAMRELLAAARHGATWVRLGDGRLLRLGEDLRRRLCQLGAAGERAPSAAAPLLDEAFAGLAEGQVQGDREWRELQERLRSAQALQPEPPAGLAATLRDYQLQGFAWLARLSAWGSGAVLADDMGLGKTVQTIALLLHRAALGPALVVCPTSVEGNWTDELARFAPALKVHSFRSRRSVEALGPGEVLLASYGLLQRRAAEFATLQVATLVADEAQQVKNADAKRSQALAGVAAGMRIALTGTPIENRLDELWSIMQVAVPGLLGTREDFAQAYAKPIEGDHDAVRRDELRRRIVPFVLRRTKEAVARELPPRTEITHQVLLRGPERALYDAERTRIIDELQQGREAEPGKDQRFVILAGLTRLRQLACAPGLVLPEYGAASAKLDALVELLEEMRQGGHRCLVFSQFTSLLDLAQERIRAAGLTALRLDGSTAQEKRRELVALFQGGTGDLFLISLRAGGTGLNLTAADYVIHLDPWWNPAVEDQATDRAHRIGQERPVTVYRLVAAETVEEKILDLHREKRDLMDALLEGADTAGRLSSEDLLAMMRGG